MTTTRTTTKAHSEYTDEFRFVSFIQQKTNVIHNNGYAVQEIKREREKWREKNEQRRQ